jgi:L-asparaginase
MRYFMKRILLLSTGGTIASRQGARGLAPAAAGAEMLQMLPGLSGICQAESRELLCLDSTNIQPEEWLHMAQQVYEALDDYDGLVISHGTDTMAYSAAALSYMLRNLHKPVIFTGSQLALTAQDSDGPGNLYDAFRVAAADKPGVYVVFAGKIIRGCRAVKVRTKGADAFFSVNAPLAGTVNASKVSWQYPLPPPHSPCNLAAHCQSRVLLLKLAPGLEPNIVDAAVVLGYRGLVVEGYGAGNVTNTRRDIAAALAQAIHSGLAVALTSQCLLEASDMSVYEPGLIMQEAGAIPAFDMTTEALYAKLCWVLGQSTEPRKVRELMSRNIAGELGG